MVQSEVRYCTTADGVRIAFSITGEGPPLLMTSEPCVSHVELEWKQPVFSRMYRELCGVNTLVRLDTRGCGLSDRVTLSSPDDQLSDIEAVVERAGLDRFSLVGVQTLAPNAIRYAARHPDRVERLVLVDGFLRFADLLNTPQVSALVGAAAGDFVMATEMMGTLAFGIGREESLEYGRYIRSCIGPEYFASAESVIGLDASADATEVRAPTLVLRHGTLQYITENMTRHLLATIPDARFETLNGAWADDPAALGARIAAFINEDRMEAARDSELARAARSGFRTVLITDLVGHTEMMQRLGDARGRNVLREHERITRETLKAHDGDEVKTLGDGFMASFGSVTKALDCAIALQRAFAVREGEPLQVRVGLNAGEPIEEDGDLFGATVIMASRICAQADAGEILIPEPLHHLLSGKSYVYADRGEFTMKGFDDRLRLYEVRWRE